MKPRKIKLDPLKQRCDRCQEKASPIYECVFAFPETYSHWKAIWQARTGKRLTNLRKARMAEREAEQLDLKALSEVKYWMDLCLPCWQEASLPWTGGFPNDFYGEVLVNNPGGPFLRGKEWRRVTYNAAAASEFVPTKTKRRASGVDQASEVI